LLVDLGKSVTTDGSMSAVYALGVVFVVVGFAFKVSAVPFHTWAPDTYEGAPTPITGFLSVASKAAGFVALVTMLYVAFPQASDVWQPFMWVLAALTMTVGNVVALRQTNIVRMIAYSSISQGGFVLMPLAVAGMDGVADSALRAVVVYLIVYAATNLGMFAVIIAVSRKTRSGQIESFGGLFSYAPALGVTATVFLASLAGIPPLGGWIAKFGAFQALLTSGSGWGYGLAVIGAVNSVIAFGYYGVVMREIWMKPAPYGDTTPIRTPASIGLALGISTVATLVLGVLPGVAMYFGDLARITGAFGS
jgi:NADH-quinone oxidoreductase subunit N